MAGFAIADRQSVLVTAAEEQIAGPLGAQDLFAQQLAGGKRDPKPGAAERQCGFQRVRLSADRRVDLCLQKQVQRVQVDIASPGQDEGSVPHGRKPFSFGQHGGHAGGLFGVNVLKCCIRGE